MCVHTHTYECSLVLGSGNTKDRKMGGGGDLQFQPLTLEQLLFPESCNL